MASSVKCPPPWDTQPATKNSTKIKEKFIAEQITTRPLNGDPKGPNMHPKSIQNLQQNQYKNEALEPV